MAGVPTVQSVPAAPTNTGAGSLIGYGTGLLNSAATGAAQAGNASSALYNPLLQQYLTGINNNPLSNLYTTGGTSNPLLEAYLSAAGINTTPVAASTQAGGTLPAGATTNQQSQTLPQPTQSGQRSAVTSRLGTPLGSSPGQVVNNGIIYDTNGNVIGPAPAGTPNGPVGGTQAQSTTPTAATSILSPGSPTPQNTESITNNVLSPQNPYGLTQAQQTQLNGQIQQYQLQAQNSVAQYQDQMAQDGVDPAHAAEGAALIQQTYSQMGDQLAAQFAQQAQQTQLTALSNLISGGQGAQSQNQSELSGILGSLQQQQNLGYSTALNAGTAALNQGNVQNQQQAQNQANSNNLLTGGLAGLGGILGAVL